MSSTRSASTFRAIPRRLHAAARAARRESYAQFREKALKGAEAARLIGTVTYRQERRSSRSGNRFAFIGFSDPTGQFEAVCFADTLASCRDLLEIGKALMLRVEADVDGEDVKLRLRGRAARADHRRAVGRTDDLSRRARGARLGGGTVDQSRPLAGPSGAAARQRPGGADRARQPLHRHPGAQGGDQGDSRRRGGGGSVGAVGR